MREILMVSALLPSLAACSLIPDYKRPALPIATTYPAGFAGGSAAAQQDAADVGWRDFVVDPVMGDLIALSLANNRDLCVAIENVRAAEATYRSDRASLFPTINAVGSGQFQRIPAGASGGLQPRLLHEGINIRLDALTEFAGNVSGGTRQGSTFASQIALQNDINWERLAGVMGLSTHVVLVSRSGSSDSHLFGDNLSPVQEVYGSGGDAAVHLVSAYAQETLFNTKLDVAIGRMNLENDFGSSPLYCNYMNNGLCGDPKALPGGDVGHSAYPDGVWAGRVRGFVAPTISITTGAYEANRGLYTDQYYRSGFKFDGAKDSGIYVPVEFAWTPSFGPDKMPGHYKLGAGYDSSSGYQDFGNGLAVASVHGFTAGSRRGNTQVWALADQMLLRQGPDKASGIIALLGFVHNDPNNSAYAEQYFAGLLDRGFWHTRPADTIGLLFIRETISGRLGNVQGVEQALDLPYSNGATGIQTREDIFEANYNIHVYSSISLQPDLQYIIRPNAQSNIGNALVLGFRAHVGF